jgi:WD40-like Beta Propeller Repeat
MLRAAAISPDGKTVAFGYHGDLWTVPSTGGAATPITVNSDYDTSPVWSPDGKQINGPRQRPPDDRQRHDEVKAGRRPPGPYVLACGHDWR